VLQDYISGDAWFGLLLPLGTPEPLLARVHPATEAALADPVLRNRLEAAGFRIAVLPPADFGKFQLAEMVRWAETVRESGVTLTN